MAQQAPGSRRINVHARTINNWRNGRSKPRTLEDPRLELVLKALAPTPEELAVLAGRCNDFREDKTRNLEKALVNNRASRANRKILVMVIGCLATIGVAVLSAYVLAPTQNGYLGEIPPDQLRLSNEGFVLPHSKDRVVLQVELENLSGWELYVARNEIFARHGRPFVEPSSGCLQRHFDRWAKTTENQDGWYVKRSGSPLVTDLEYQNAASIRDYECRVRGGQYTCNGKLNPCR